MTPEMVNLMVPSELNVVIVNDSFNRAKVSK